MTIDDFIANPASRFATVAMTDTNGLLRGQMVSAKGLKGIAQNGMGMAPVTLALEPTDEINHIPGISDDSADFHDDPLEIDPDTTRRLPWSQDGDDLLVLANYTGPTADMCPRSILKRVLNRATEAGLTPKYGLELEYTLFDETAETAAAKGYRNLKTATPHKSHDLLIYQVAQSDWYAAVADMCTALRIDLAKMHEEIGGGFMEACIEAGKGLAPADQMVLLKNFLKVLAMRHDRTISYMPRWSEAADSQSMHLHVSLLDDAGKPLFHDPSKPHNMSDTFRHFIGGMQSHIGDMTLIFLPTVNSFRRFAPGTFAPPALSWGYENRTTCFRVVGENSSSLRVENRLAGADVNPYLNVAATLAAGLDGVINKIEPEAEVIGNGYAQETGPDFARAMPEAISRMAASSFAQDWLSPRFVEAFSASRQSQYDGFQGKIPDVELERFFDLG
jgi:glutamine synthetase